eukprot:g8011.t1
MNGVFSNGRFTSSRILKRRFSSYRQKSSVSNSSPTRRLLLLNSNDGSTNLKTRISKSIKFRIELLQNSSIEVIKHTEQKKGLPPFTLIQSTAAAGCLMFAAMSQSPVTGTLLVALSVSISLTGYLNLLHQTLPCKYKTPLALYNAAYSLSKKEYSFQVDQSWTEQIGVMLNSLFYEPSPLYLALNCWGMYAIGQRLITVQLGGLGLLTLCFAAMFLSRFIQYMISKDTTTSEKTSLVQRGLIELVCLPTGTWGFGPVLNCMIWFCCFSFPRVLYLATPTGVMAPVWTALAVPIVLLIEDVWSLVRPIRRQEKIDDGCAPGLQLGAILVAWIASIVMK